MLIKSLAIEVMVIYECKRSEKEVAAVPLPSHPKVTGEKVAPEIALCSAIDRPKDQLSCKVILCSPANQSKINKNPGRLTAVPAEDFLEAN